MALGIFPLIVAALVVVPFVTYYLSLSLFQRKIRGNATEKTPPTIPFYFPGVFHAFGLAYVGPQKYFAYLLYVIKPIHVLVLTRTGKNMKASVSVPSSSMRDHSHSSSFVIQNISKRS
jgi:hypothetical protein